MSNISVHKIFNIRVSINRYKYSLMSMDQLMIYINETAD